MPEDAITFNLRTINVFEFHYKNPLDFADPIHDFANIPIGLKYHINYRWKLEENLFGVVIELVFESNRDGVIEEIMKLKYIMEFIVKDLKSKMTVRSNNDFDINEILEMTLVNMAYSTGRGILFEKTQGTHLAGLILPPASPKDLILSNKLKNAKTKSSPKTD